jgi:uncharacterized membrane protein YhaH (DUF805 family)
VLARDTISGNSKRKECHVNQTPSFGGGEAIGLLVFALFGLAIAAFMLWVWARIFSSAGYSGWMCLLMIVPLANIIWLLIFAFSKWPVVRELETYRQRYGSLAHGFEMAPGGYATPPGGGYPAAGAPRA